MALQSQLTDKRVKLKTRSQSPPQKLKKVKAARRILFATPALLEVQPQHKSLCVTLKIQVSISFQYIHARGYLD